MDVEPELIDRRQRTLKLVAIGCLVVFVVAGLMEVVGDPWWNLYVVLLGLFVAPPVGLIAVALLLLSRRRSA